MSQWAKPGTRWLPLFSLKVEPAGDWQTAATIPPSKHSPGGPARGGARPQGGGGGGSGGQQLGLCFSPVFVVVGRGLGVLIQVLLLPPPLFFFCFFLSRDRSAARMER